LARVIIVCSLILGPKVAPLKAIHGSEIADAAVSKPNAVKVLARPVAIPNMHALVCELGTVRAARDEPEQLLYDAASEHALGRQKRERAVGEREAKGWRGKQRDGARARPVGARLPCADDARDEVQVLVLLCGIRCWVSEGDVPCSGLERVVAVMTDCCEVDER
jgi:hypothetical protein